MLCGVDESVVGEGIVWGVGLCVGLVVESVGVVEGVGVV